MTRLSLRTACALIALTGAAAAAPAYTVQTVVDPLDPGFTEAFGINDAGTVVGTHNATINQGFSRNPNGTFTEIIVPHSAQTQVTGIANNGQVAGITVDQAGVTHGFEALPGPVTVFPQPGPVQQPGTGGSFVTVDRPNTAFNQLLGLSSNSTQFAGYSSTDPGGAVLQHAYIGVLRITGGANTSPYTDVNAILPPNFNSQSTGINNAADSVGFFMPTADTSIGFEDIGNVIKQIDPFGSTNTQALGINDHGEIVGFYVDAAGVQHGYTDIGGVFASFDPMGSLSTTINGVNNLGQLVGFYTTAADTVVGFVATPGATPAPEPGTVAMLGAGMLGLAGVVRRRAAA